MQNDKCPKCGQENAPDAACPDCGRNAVNGAGTPKRTKPPPPTELAGRTFTPTPPGMVEEFLRTFDEEEYLAAARELERSGGVPFEEIMAEIERKLHGRN